MAKGFNDRIFATVDVGTTKICVLVARQLADKEIEVIGCGKAPSDGLSKGVVVDVAKTIHSIRSAIKEAELMAGVPIESVTVGISGAHISSLNSQGVVPIKRGDIRENDVAAVLAAARAIPIPDGQQILHVLPQYYVIDGRDRVTDPRGMHGIRLEVQAHIIMGAIASVQNLVKCCESAGVAVHDIVLEQLASALCVLSEDEQKLGVAVLDIGGGTSDFAIYQHGTIRHTKVLPVAGNHFTNDIAVGLCTTLKDAERVKKEHGAAASPLEKDEFIEVEMVHGEQKQVVRSSDLVRIIEPRAQELLAIVHEEILSKRLEPFITTGIVLTGGGSLLKGIQPLAEKMLDLPVRIGHLKVPFSIPDSLHSPIYATGYGLLMHTIQKQKENEMSDMSGPLLKKVLNRMKAWMVDFF
jgi:cell division protein FtsA